MNAGALLFFVYLRTLKTPSLVDVRECRIIHSAWNLFSRRFVVHMDQAPGGTDDEHSPRSTGVARGQPNKGPASTYLFCMRVGLLVVAVKVIFSAMFDSCEKLAVNSWGKNGHLVVQRTTFAVFVAILA